MKVEAYSGLYMYENAFNRYPELNSMFSHILEEYKENASPVIWALVLSFHPRSLWHNLPTKEKTQAIEKDYLKFSLDWEKHAKDIEYLKKLFLSKAMQYLIAWETKLDDRQNFIASLPYDGNNYEMLDKMMSSTDKMWKQYMVCIKDVEDEEATAQGKSQESLSESKLI